MSTLIKGNPPITVEHERERLVTWISGGQAWTRCEDHVPESVRLALDNPPVPLVEVEWMLASDRERRCYACLVGAPAGRLITAADRRQLWKR